MIDRPVKVEKLELDLRRGDRPFFVGRYGTSADYGIAHVHRGLELGVAAEGKGTYYYRGGAHPMTKGDIYYTNGMIPHSHWGESLVLVFAHISTDSLSAIGGEDEVGSLLQPFLPAHDAGLPPLLRDDETVEALLRSFETFNDGKPFARIRAWQGMLSALCCLSSACRKYLRLDQTTATQHLSMVRAQDYIRQHSEEHISAAQLAAQLNMSSSHFAHLFKQYTQESPLQYRDRMRTEKAMNLLASNTNKISDVAFTCGYSDIAQFNKTFRRITSVTPSEFRKRQKSLNE